MAQAAQNAKISVDSARAMKGKLMTSPTIFENLVLGGYDPKKIPGWVARPPGTKAVPVAQPSQAVAQPSQAVAQPSQMAPVAAPVEKAAEGG